MKRCSARRTALVAEQKAVTAQERKFIFSIDLLILFQEMENLFFFNNFTSRSNFTSGFSETLLLNLAPSSSFDLLRVLLFTFDLWDEGAA